MNFSGRRLLDFVTWKPTQKYPETSAISFRLRWWNMDSPYVRVPMWMPPAVAVEFPPRITVLLNFWGLGLLIAEEAGHLFLCLCHWPWKVNCRVVDWWIKFFCKGFCDPKGCGYESSFDCFVDAIFRPISQQFFPQSILEICAEPSDICRPWWKPRGISQPLLLSFALLQVLMYDPGLADALGSSGFTENTRWHICQQQTRWHPKSLNFLWG